MSSTERQYESDWLKFVMSREFSMEVRVIEAVAAPGLAMKSGEIMALGTGVKLACIGAANGADAIAILAAPVTLTESLADTNRLVLVGVAKGVVARGGAAVVNGSQLKTSVSATQVAQAKAALLTLGIVALTEPASTTQST